MPSHGSASRSKVGSRTMDGPVVVIDTGSSATKVGFAGEHRPRSVVPSVIGRPRYPSVLVVDTRHRGVYVGAAAEARRGVLSLERPMRNRAVADWDTMELLWSHALRDELGLTGSGGAALLAVGPQSQRQMRERMMCCFFERFAMDKVHLSVQPVLALYATGRTTGIVVDSGHDLTHVVPVHNGNVLGSKVQRMDFGGQAVTEALAQQLGPALGGPELELVREVKERLAYVALDYDAEVAAVERGELEPATYALPDGTQLEVPAERFACAEPLFRPGAGPGLADLVHRCAAGILPGLQARLLANVVMAGGNTLLPNMERRLERDLRPLTPRRVRVEAPPERKYSAWLGGSILASLPSFQGRWVTRSEFEEHGAAIMDRKCEIPLISTFV